MSSAAEIPVPVRHRWSLAPAAVACLPAHQARWAIVQGTAFAGLSAVPALAGWTDLVFGLALGLGSAAATKTPRAAIAVFLASLLGVLLPGLLGPGDSTLSAWAQPGLASAFAECGLSGVQVWTGGAALGLALGSSTVQSSPARRQLQLALAGATTIALGWSVARAVVPSTWSPALQTLVHGGLTALVGSQVLLVTALRKSVTEEVPSVKVLQRHLAPAFAEVALRARALDRDVAVLAPDPVTRDGLGEVAVWIVRLQATLQALEASLEALGPAPLVLHKADLAAAAEASDDDFVRNQRLATLQHLEQLARHRTALHVEHARTTALSDRAMAFLEEARAGLSLAQVSPGDHRPQGLDAVLRRLRDQGAEGAARRRTARELGPA